MGKNPCHISGRDTSDRVDTFRTIPISTFSSETVTSTPNTPYPSPRWEGTLAESAVKTQNDRARYIPTGPHNNILLSSRHIHFKYTLPFSTDGKELLASGRSTYKMTGVGTFLPAHIITFSSVVVTSTPHIFNLSPQVGKNPCRVNGQDTSVRVRYPLLDGTQISLMSTRQHQYTVRISWCVAVFHPYFPSIHAGRNKPLKFNQL